VIERGLFASDASPKALSVVDTLQTSSFASSFAVSPAKVNGVDPNSLLWSSSQKGSSAKSSLVASKQFESTSDISPMPS
jgi:hypothetical protein